MSHQQVIVGTTILARPEIPMPPVFNPISIMCLRCKFSQKIKKR